MINYLYASPSADGWMNLAADEWLLDHLSADSLLLYFYVNENAVIIGKNQNPWRECDLSAMERDGVQLVRRVSGGGAVYHDTGNLNFSFIAGNDRFDETAQLSMILRAVRALGIECGFSGRNDLLAGGRKFSGNAFCHRGGNSQHHGTLLVESDLTRLQRYLRPDPRKLRAKGVDSVRSRVCNLGELRPGLTVARVRAALEAAFGETFGPWKAWIPDARAEAGIAAYREKHSSWDWRLGKTPAFDLELEHRFEWGGVQLLLTLSEGRVASLAAYTDALDEALPVRLRDALTGRRLGPELAGALSASEDPQLLDVAAWLSSERL